MLRCCNPELELEVTNGFRQVLVSTGRVPYITYKCHVKVLGVPEFKGRAGKYRG